MSEELKLKVSLDAKAAKQAFDDMMKNAGQKAREAGAKLRATVSQELGMATYQTAYSSGMDALRSPTSSGVSDIMSEALGGFGRQIENAALGDLAYEARASMSAREETIQAFGMVVGMRDGAIPPEARNYMKSIESVHKIREKGRAKIEMDENMRGPGLDDIIKKIGEMIGKLLSNAVADLVKGLGPFSNR